MNYLSTLTGVQIRMARNALRWSVRELALRTSVSTSTIVRAEAEDGLPNTTRANLSALLAAFEAGGIEFIGTPDDGPGIRIRTGSQD